MGDRLSAVVQIADLAEREAALRELGVQAGARGLSGKMRASVGEVGPLRYQAHRAKEILNVSSLFVNKYNEALKELRQLQAGS